MNAGLTLSAVDPAFFFAEMLFRTENEALLELVAPARVEPFDVEPHGLTCWEQWLTGGLTIALDGCAETLDVDNAVALSVWDENIAADLALNDDNDSFVGDFRQLGKKTLIAVLSTVVTARRAANPFDKCFRKTF